MKGIPISVSVWDKYGGKEAYVLLQAQAREIINHLIVDNDDAEKAASRLGRIVSSGIAAVVHRKMRRGRT